MKRIFTLLLLSNLFITVQSQHECLPKPTGEYFVGVSYLDFIDNSRKELFDNSRQKNREITLKVWYPADNKTEYEPYLLNPELAFATKFLQYPEFFKSLTSNSSRDVPLSSKEKDYPILIFSHGWGEHYSQNSILMEELASHGYIVFSLSHHYECKFSSSPDGRLMYIDMTNSRLQKIMGEMSDPKVMKLLQKFPDAGNDEERLQIFDALEKASPGLLQGSLNYWREDISFFIDRLWDINNDNEIFKDRLDIDRLGVFGMSLGGLASLEASLADERIGACVNMDGGLNSRIAKNPISSPVMFLNSQRYIGYGDLFVKTCGVDCYSFTVRNSGHYNFTDFSIYPVPMVKPLLGIIEGSRTVKIMNVLVLDFFDRYIKEKRDVDILKDLEAFPEIEAVMSQECYGGQGIGDWGLGIRDLGKAKLINLPVPSRTGTRHRPYGFLQPVTRNKLLLI